MKNLKIFASLFAMTVLAVIIITSCSKEKNQATVAPHPPAASIAGECNYNYNTSGYIVQENGILNFQNSQRLKEYIASTAPLEAVDFKLLEQQNGLNTAYGNYIEADEALSALMAQYENSTSMTDATFQPIFNSFRQSNASLAKISTEGVEPYFSFPYYYFVNSEGKFRICSQEFSLLGSIMFSYPVGREELVEEWDGKIGDFGDLSVQKLENARTTKEIQERDEEVSVSCTDELDNNNKKRIKVFWDSDSFRTFDEVNFPETTIYHWAHQAEVKAQKKSWGIWWSDERHMSLAVNGTITNRHTHPSINFLKNYPTNFFKCKKAKSIKEFFAGDFLLSYTNSSQNNFALGLSVVGTNRTSDCVTVQASCTLSIANL